MARVSIRKVEDLQWFDAPKDDYYGEMSKVSTVCMHHVGTEDTPQLFEVKAGPNKTVPVHSHDHDEIIYVVSGEMRIGNTVLRPGSSMLIKGDTLYSFSSGSEGLHFLNFRPVIDKTYRTPEDVEARRSKTS